jgi:hypothetical protein
VIFSPDQGMPMFHRADRKRRKSQKAAKKEPRRGRDGVLKPKGFGIRPWGRTVDADERPRSRSTMFLKGRQSGKGASLSARARG